LEHLKYLSYAPIVFISALTGQRVSKILDVVDHVAEEAKKRITTSLLNRYFGKWVEEVSPPLYKSRRVKLNYITQVSTGPPTFVISANFPLGIHFSYERYLMNRMREALVSTGFRSVFNSERRARIDRVKNDTADVPPPKHKATG